MSKQKLLVVIPFIPFPLDSGGNQGSFNMLNFLKDYYDLYLWFHVNNEKKTKPVISRLLKALDGKCHIYYTANSIGLNFITFRAVFRFLSRLFLKKDLQWLHLNLLGGGFDSCYSDVIALRDINSIIVDNNINIVQIEFVPDFVYGIPSNVKKIFIHHELLMGRLGTQYKQISPKIVFDRYLLKRHKAVEVLDLNQYDCVVVMSEVDKKKLVEAGVSSNVVVSPSFIPKKNKEYPDFVFSNHRLSYVASNSHFPNVEGLTWFIKNVHPFIVKKSPNYVLDVIGRGWKEKSVLCKIPSNIHFLGFVDDLSIVVPGSKILEAINNSVPFVSTSVGIEGLVFDYGKDCFVDDSAENFAESIIKLFDSESLQMSFVYSSRTVYENNYSASVLSRKRLKILTDLN
jgi:glycosyltransferase involved in cell wall biosynthesis